MKYGPGALDSIAVVASGVFAVASISGISGEGAQAPDFDFSMFQRIEEAGFRDGKLARFEGKSMVLNFWV